MVEPSQARKSTSEPEPFRTATCRGVLDPEHRAALMPLCEAAGPDQWSGLLHDLQEVKSSTVRTTMRGEIDGLRVHVKLYRATRLSDRARDALGGSRGENEFTNLADARALGLSAVRPLLAGVYAGTFGARSFLLTETVADAVSLPPGLGDDDRNRAAGRLLRSAHDAGLHVPDLHPGNVLVTPEGEAWLVDLTHARFSSVVELAERARGLAFFCQGLDGGLADPRAAAFWEGYVGAGLATEAALLERALRAGGRIRNRALSAFGRRAFRPCRHTRIVERKKGEAGWFFHRTDDPQRDAPKHEDARRLEAELDRHEPLRSGRRGAVHLLDGLVVKTREPGAGKRLWQAAYWLLYAGVPGPTPVALALRPGRAAVFFGRVGDRDLRRELPELGSAELQVCARSLGDGVGRLHAFGLRNRDLKLDNLVRDPGTGTVHMIDLDGLRRKHPSDRRGQAADLGRLLAAFRDVGEPGGSGTARAFLRAYLMARRRLGRPLEGRWVWRRASRRAREWASAHA